MSSQNEWKEATILKPEIIQELTEIVGKDNNYTSLEDLPIDAGCCAFNRS